AEHRGRAGREPLAPPEGADGGAGGGGRGGSRSEARGGARGRRRGDRRALRPGRAPRAIGLRRDPPTVGGRKLVGGSRRKTGQAGPTCPPWFSGCRRASRMLT